MNKVKRGLQLSAGIVGICFSALLVIGSLYVLSYTSAVLGYLDGWSDVFEGQIYSMLILVLLLGVANVVMCALLCRNKPALGVAITALVLNGISLLIYLASMSWYVIFPIAIVGLLIASLCMKDTEVAPATPSGIPATPTIPLDTPAVSAEDDTAGISAKITQLKKLHKSGLITETELKEFVKKELSK